MSSHPFTSTERRGILIVAALSLLITGAGLFVSYCDRPASTIEPQDVEMLYKPDPVKAAYADSVAKAMRKARRDSLRKVRRDSLRNLRRDSLRRHGKMKSKRAVKTYRRRSPIDEPAK